MSKNLKKSGPKESQFSSTNQPTGEAKSKGMKRRKLLKEIASSIVTGTAKEIAEKVALFVGIEVEEMDLETLAGLRQLQKAIQKGDTRAYIAVMDRIQGKPKQSVEVKDTTDTTEQEDKLKKLPKDVLLQLYNEYGIDE